MGDHTSRGGESPTQRWQNLSDDSLAILNGRAVGPAEPGSFLSLVPLDEFAHLINNVNRVQVAFALCHSPGEKPMSAENDAVRTRVFPHRLFNQQGQVESRTLPRDPDDAVAEEPIEFIEFVFAVGACRQRDRPIGVQVVDMGERQEGV